MNDTSYLVNLQLNSRDAPKVDLEGSTFGQLPVAPAVPLPDEVLTYVPRPPPSKINAEHDYKNGILISH